MNADGLGFWGAVIAMAVITYLTRALPFMLSERSRLLRHLSREGSALASRDGPSAASRVSARSAPRTAP